MCPTLPVPKEPFAVTPQCGDLDPNLALGSSGVPIFLLTLALMDSSLPGPLAGDDDLSLLFPTCGFLVGGFLYAPFPSAGIAE